MSAGQGASISLEEVKALSFPPCCRELAQRFPVGAGFKPAHPPVGVVGQAFQPAIIVSGAAQMAERFGATCERVSIEAGLSPFYVGYAREALARAALASGAKETAASRLAKAEADLARVEDKEERELLETDLVSLRRQLS